MFRPFTLQELKNLLETNYNIKARDVLIQPPRYPSVSEEGREDPNVYCLPPFAMGEPAYLTQHGDDDEFNAGEFSYKVPKDDDELPELPSISSVPKRKKRKMTIIERKWKKIDLTVQPTIGRVTKQSIDFFNQPRAPTEIFELFLDDDVVGLIVQYSNAYAASKGLKLDLTSSEFKGFLGVIFVSGYVALSQRHVLWKHRNDTHNLLIYYTMKYERFETIYSNLCVADNTNLDPTDEFASLRPLITKLNERFLKFVPNETYYNFDEIMIHNFGQYEHRQYVQGEPIHFGYKFWCGATSQEYVCWFEPKQGNLHQIYDVDDSPVVQFSKALTKAYPGQYHFVLDVLTSFPLLDKLRSMGHQATGKVTQNRTEGAPLQSNATLRMKEIGSFDYQSDDKGNILCKWKDNGVITVASSGAGIEPLNSVSPSSQRWIKNIKIRQPNLIKVYNDFKGSVVRANENIFKYRAFIPGEKWYSSPLLFCFELIVQNSWQLNKIHNELQIDLSSFRKCIANSYLKAGATPTLPPF